MKLSLMLLITLSSLSSFAHSNLEELAKDAKTCQEYVSTNISMQLSLAADGDDLDASDILAIIETKNNLNARNKQLEESVKACDSEPSQDKASCLLINYRAELSVLYGIQSGADFAKDLPACKLLIED